MRVCVIVNIETSETIETIAGSTAILSLKLLHIIGLNSKGLVVFQSRYMCCVVGPGVVGYSLLKCRESRLIERYTTLSLKDICVFFCLFRRYSPLPPLACAHNHCHICIFVKAFNTCPHL